MISIIVKRSIIILSVALAVVALFMMANPLRTPETELNRNILSKTPLGSSMDEVIQIIKENGWNFSVNEDASFFHQRIKPNQFVGSKSIRADLNNSNSFVSGLLKSINQTCDDLLSPLGYVKLGKIKGFHNWQKVPTPGLSTKILFDYRGTFGAGLEYARFSTSSEYIFEVGEGKFKYYPSKFLSGTISGVHYCVLHHIWDFELATRVELENYVLIHEVADPLAMKHFTAFCEKNS